VFNAIHRTLVESPLSPCFSENLMICLGHTGLSSSTYADSYELLRCTIMLHSLWDLISEKCIMQNQLLVLITLNTYRYHNPGNYPSLQVLELRRLCRQARGRSLYRLRYRDSPSSIVQKHFLTSTSFSFSGYNNTARRSLGSTYKSEAL
jgi:hypothetical protein